MTFQTAVTSTSPPPPASLAAAPPGVTDAAGARAPGAAHGLWQRVRESAWQVAGREPQLRRVLDELICTPATPAELMAAVLARRLGTRDLREVELRALITDVLSAHEPVVAAMAADLAAIYVRDPAVPNCLHALLNLKGFHALQTYRVAHVLWQAGRRELAFSLSNHASAAFAVDVHPAARIGSGVMFDHGTGIVVGETAVIDDDVSILQNVTLGGTGKEHGDRHPKIRCGVMIGAGAKILGNIEIGTMSKVAAGSVVLKNVPPHCTVAGIPARIVNFRERERESYPAFEMDQML